MHKFNLIVVFFTFFFISTNISKAQTTQTIGPNDFNCKNNRIYTKTLGSHDNLDIYSTTTNNNNNDILVSMRVTNQQTSTYDDYLLSTTGSEQIITIDESYPMGSIISIVCSPNLPANTSKDIEVDATVTIEFDLSLNQPALGGRAVGIAEDNGGVRILKFEYFPSAEEDYLAVLAQTRVHNFYLRQSLLG